MTTSSGSKRSTNSRARASAASMSSRRSCDGPGRFNSGLWDIQHRASGTVSSRGQGEDVEERGTQLGGELSDTRARETTGGGEEQAGFPGDGEPGFGVAWAGADGGHVGLVVTGP